MDAAAHLKAENSARPSLHPTGNSTREYDIIPPSDGTIELCRLLTSAAAAAAPMF